MTRQELLKNIGRSVIFHRQKKGWSQAQLARACNKDRQAIEKIENGKVNSTAFSLQEVADALEITLATLLDFKKNG